MEVLMRKGNPMHEKIIQTLQHNELFRGMTEAELSKIASLAQPITYNAGDVIFQQGDAGETLYLIYNGQVEVQVQTDKTTTSAVYLGMGQTVGEMALVDQATRSASIIAVDQPTELFRINSQALIDLCQTEARIGYSLMRNIAQDLSFKLRHSDAKIKTSESNKDKS
jgi:CRP/FNR family cyclic AMP-dependent transcriptional regulator